MAVGLYVPTRYATRRDEKLALAKSKQAPHYRSGRLAGGWISDLVALNRSILLCPFHVNKFTPKQYGYEAWRMHTPFVFGTCDDCKQAHPRCKMWIPEQVHDLCGDPFQKRKGRWAN